MEIIPRATYLRNPESSPRYASYIRPWGAIEVSNGVIKAGVLVEQQRVVEPKGAISAVSQRINTPSGRRLKNARDAFGPLRVSLLTAEEGDSYREWLSVSGQFYRWEMPIVLATNVSGSTPDMRAASVMQFIYDQTPGHYARCNEQLTDYPAAHYYEGSAGERKRALVEYMASCVIADTALIFQEIPGNPHN